MKPPIPSILTAAFALTTNLAVAQAAPPPPPPPAPPLAASHQHDGELVKIKAPQTPQPFLGVSTEPVDTALSTQLGLGDGLGLIVREVLPGGSAEKAGVQQHDVLKQINDQLLASPEQLATLVRHYGKDTDVSLTIIRKGQEQQITVKIGEHNVPPRHPFPSGQDVLRHLPFLDNLKTIIPKFDGNAEEIQKQVDAWTRDLNQNGDKLGERIEKMVEQLVERIGGNPPAKAKPAPSKPEASHGDDHELSPEIKMQQDQVRTTYNTANARVILKDGDGEIDVKSENGNRTLVAKNAKGETVFTGPINTDEERNKVPELFRNKLTKIDVQTKIDVELETH